MSSQTASMTWSKTDVTAQSHAKVGLAVIRSSVRIFLNCLHKAPPGVKQKPEDPVSLKNDLRLEKSIINELSVYRKQTVNSSSLLNTPRA